MNRARSTVRHPRRRRSRPTAAAVGLVIASLAWPASLAAQRRASGLRLAVIAAGEERPIAGAVIRVGNGGVIGRTDAYGTVRLDAIPPGPRVVSVEAPGFLTDRSLFTFVAGRVLEATLRLRPDPIPLASVGIEVPTRRRWLEMAGFYERAEGGLGTFLGPDDVEERARRAARLSDLLRAMPGLRVAPNPAAPGTYVVESRRGRVSFRQPCRPQFWLDGVPLGMPRDVHVDAIAHPSEILAVEVYDGPADVPSAFKGVGGACGAILLWTGGRRQ